MPQQVTQVKPCHLQKKQGKSSLNEKKNVPFHSLVWVMKSIYIYFSTVTHHFPCESSWKNGSVCWWHHCSFYLIGRLTVVPLTHFYATLWSLIHQLIMLTVKHGRPPWEHTVSQENPWSGLNVTTTVTVHHQTEGNLFLPYYMCAKQNLCPETIWNNNLNMMHCTMHEL